MEKQAIPSIELAVELFDQQKYREAFSTFVKIYQNSHDEAERESIFQVLEEAYYLPNEDEIKQNYNKNCTDLKNYPYQWGIAPEKMENLPFQIFPVSDQEYCLYNKEKRCFSDIHIYSGDVESDYLLQDLDKPVIRVNDCNEYHWRFLYDNIRRSEDYGADNHIYLYFSSFDALAPLFMLCRLEPLLKDKKFVFLVGEENLSRYPVDFKRTFGIDYKKMGPKPVRLEEIKRLVIFGFTTGHCGNTMIDSLLDFHPNLLTVKEFGLSMFPTFYENCLRGESVDSFLRNLIEHQQEEKYRFIFTFFEKIYRKSASALPESSEFFDYLQQILGHLAFPTKQQWFIAFYLANSFALHRNLNARAVPAVFYAPHIIWECDGELESAKIQDVCHSFPYVKLFMTTRNQSFRIAGAIKYELKCRELYNLRSKNEMFSFLFSKSNDEWAYIDWRRIYFDEHALFHWNQMAVVRYEDIKTKPKETLLALCRFLDIPWADTLMYCSHNGEKTIYIDAGTVISDFDPAPLTPEYYQKYLNDFDRFRIELLYEKFYEPWKYRTQFQHKLDYSNQEIKELFTIPFEFEGPSSQWSSQYIQKRWKIMESLDHLLNFLSAFEEKKRAGKVLPVQMIQPEGTEE